jgi:hypothetical protein
LVLRPSAGAFDAVYRNVLIFIKELGEFLRGFRGTFRHHAKEGQRLLQDGEQPAEMGVGMPAAEIEMEAQDIESWIGFQVEKDEE